MRLHEANGMEKRSAYVRISKANRSDKKGLKELKHSHLIIASINFQWQVSNYVASGYTYPKSFCSFRVSN